MVTYLNYAHTHNGWKIVRRVFIFPFFVFPDKSLGDTSDIISDSSGVGTSNSDTTNPSITLPGTTVVCTESYSSNIPGHLSIAQGDILEGDYATPPSRLFFPCFFVSFAVCRF